MRGSRGSNIETTYMYFDGQSWRGSATNATLRLAREKIYSYSDFSTNRIDVFENGHWRPASSEELAQFSGLQQGHYYEATPYESESLARCWEIRSIRVGDEFLVELGLQKKSAFKIDFEFKVTDELYKKVKLKIESLGGVVVDLTVDLGDVQVQAAHATALHADLQRLLFHSHNLLAQNQPDASSVAQVEQWREEAIDLQYRYHQERQHIRTMVERLQRDKGRSDEKAQAQALVSGLPESVVVEGISGVLASLIAARAQALGAANSFALTDPKMALLAHALKVVYGAVVSFDDKQRIELTVKHRTLILEPGRIEVQ